MSDTFIKITNNDIYDEIKKEKVLNAKRHQILLGRSQRTDGKVKANRWMITSMWVLLIALTGWFFTHLNTSIPL